MGRMHLEQGFFSLQATVQELFYPGAVTGAR